MYYPKDFIETASGLAFAVVSEGTENGQVLCFLRYVKVGSGWQKLATEASNDYLARFFPHYLYYSAAKDAHCHALAVSEIHQHYQPRQHLQQLLKKPPQDSVIADFQQLLRLLQEHHLDSTSLGITGSVLIGAQQESSDLDLVIYDRESFHQIRRVIQTLLAQNRLQPLTDADWLESYRRRDCDLSFEDYVWHERRKLNKVTVNGRKVDLSLLTAQTDAPTHFVKLGLINTICKVIDAGLSYDYPAEYVVDAGEFEKVVCFTATYLGQALAGETIEISGQLEVSKDSRKRVVVGSNREARGEYIKIVNSL